MENKVQKALSIKQPFASLIALGIKPIENRTWRTNFRGRIYIHASSPRKFDIALTDDQTRGALPVLEKAFKGELPFGAIIGEVDIVDCVINHPSIWAEKSKLSSSWNNFCKNKPIWNWVLANPVMYEEPILNVKGKLSFWEFNK